MATAVHIHGNCSAAAITIPQTGKKTPFLGLKTINKTPLRLYPLRPKNINNHPNLRRRQFGPLRIVSKKVVGINLGTTNLAMAAMKGRQPTIVTNAKGQRKTPSVVAYSKAGDRLVGQIAKRQAVVNPENTFFSVKRSTGRKMNKVDEESKQVLYLNFEGLRNVIL